MVIHFPAYRRYNDARIEGNDAMVALLIGTRISKYTLETHTAETSAFLPSIFDQVPGVSQLNRTIEDTIQILDDAQRHFAYMAITYALSIHGSLLVDAAKILRDDGHEPRTLKVQEDLNRISLEDIHEYIADCSEQGFSEVWLSLFHFTRCIRNRIIHYASTPGSHLGTIYNELSKEAKDEWKSLTGRNFRDVLKAEHLALSDKEVAATFSITLRLAEELNSLLRQTITRTTWASIVVDDYKKSNPDRFKDRGRRLVNVTGYARTLYGPLELTEDELSATLDTIR